MSRSLPEGNQVVLKIVKKIAKNHVHDSDIVEQASNIHVT